MATSTAPLRVVCTNCSTKFHVSEQLVRGRQVKFRCRRCRSPIDVDGTALSTSHVSQVSLFPRPSENDPPTTFPISQASMRLSTSDGLEGLSIVSANPAYSTPPPPNSTWVATTVAPPPQQHTSRPPDQQFFPPPPRESTDPFALRPAPPAAIVAPPDLFSTLPPVTKLQGYSDAPTELPRAEVPLAPERHIGRAVFLAALFAAAGWTAWTFMGSSPNATRAPQGGVAARMQADDFQGVTAEPLKQAKAGGTVPSTTTIAPTAPPVPSVATASPAPQVLVPGAAAPAKVGAAPAKVAAQAKVERDEPAEDPEIEALQKTTNENVPGARQAVADPAPVPTAAAPANGAAIDLGEPSTGGGPADEFDTTLARASLEEAGRRAGECRTVDTPAGGARIAVTFAPTGRVTSAVIEAGPFAGTPAGGCVVSKFRTAHVPPFSGESVTVHKTVSF